MRPIYEWRWERDGHPAHSTRSPRKSAMFKRFAAKLGGTVTRTKVGYKLVAPELLDQLNEWARQELGEENTTP